jgi:hypothetical protein
MPPSESVKRVAWFTQMMLMYTHELANGRLANGEVLKGLVTVIANYVAETADDEETIAHAFEMIGKELALFTCPEGMEIIRTMRERRAEKDALEERRASRSPLN